MSGLFENLAATDDSAFIAHRQATAVANKRVKDRFGGFLANAQGDRPARLALVEDEITTIVADVVTEYGGDARTIESAIRHSLGMPDPTNPGMMGGQSAPNAGQGQAAPPAAAPGGGQTCPQCGGPMVNGQCPTCQGAGGSPGAPMAAGGTMGYGMGHTMPQGPSSGPIQSAVIAAGGYCDSCKGWKHKGDCHCEAETVDHEEGTDGNDGDDGGTTSSFRLARRPKMCPYHSEVVDIALGAGDPQAGFNAMANHAWGDQHCKGGFDGACNFRPSMVTQKYWDDKQLEADERREQRELDRQLPAASDLSIDTEPIMHAEPLSDEPGKEGVSDIDGELADAPSAIGAGEMATVSHRKEAEALKTVDLPAGDDTGLGGPSPKIDKSKSGDQGGWSLDPIDTEMDGSPHPSIEQDPTDKADYNKDAFLDQTKAVNKSEKLPTETGDAGYNTRRNIKQYPTKTWSGESDQTDPVTRESLSAKLDEKEREALPSKDFAIPGKAPGSGSYPIEDKDHAEKAEQFASGTAEEEEVDEKVHKKFPDLGKGKKSNGDPDKNPIRAILEEYSGFLMPNQVEAAIRLHDES